MIEIAPVQDDETLALRSIIGRLDGFLYRCRADADYTMLYITEPVVRVTGFPAGDFIDNRIRSYVSITYQPDIQHVFDVVDAAIAAGKPWNVDYRLVKNDGGTVWVNEVGAAIFAADGSLEFLEGAVININDRKLVELKTESIVDAVTQESTQIVSTTGKILKILNRLRMLAFNARIEAARAGETGRGFTVVAQEIKSMADESTELASHITQSTRSLDQLLRG